MANVPDHILPPRSVGSSVQEIDLDSTNPATADQWSLMEKRPLISPTESKWDSKSLEIVEEYTRRLKWPLAVIIGQALLLALSWGFLGVVRARGQIAAPFIIANTFQKYPLYTTYVFTILASALSACSSYLLSQAVRHAIVVYLTRPMTLSSLDFAISISQQKPIFELREVKWVIVAAVFWGTTFQQTSRHVPWSTLLTPINIVVDTSVQATELDIMTDAFNNQFDQLWWNTSAIAPYLYSSMLSILDTSGASSANSMVGYPMVLGFAGNTYRSSTGGIYPIRFNADPATGSLPPLFTANTQSLPAFNISSNISMSQQGLTAAVSWNITYDTFSLFWVTIRTLIIDGWGTYSIVPGGGTLLCQITPKIQNMTTSYSNGYVSSERDPNSPPSDDAGGIGWAAMWALDQLLGSGQSTSRDRVGDAVTAIYTNQNVNPPLSYSSIWEAYIRGAIEFVGTALKHNLSAADGPLGGTPLQNMTRQANGTAMTTTPGWAYEAGWNILILLPTTFVGVASILIVAFATYQNRGAVMAIRHADFDPGDPMLLIAAASAGGIGDTFHGLAKKNIKEERRKQVTIAPIGDRDGFVEVVAKFP
ncbi:hypothetical protein C8R44DRAFT_992395 [Mycena epipterygia]|nr:hypothetical protein C8R44DRAFT_992395 [Mycena epipterygia]